ncbi:hypothetical protein V8F33_003070 [Rhypophila sp. PSN 637]
MARSETKNEKASPGNVMLTLVCGLATVATMSLSLIPKDPRWSRDDIAVVNLICFLFLCLPASVGYWLSLGNLKGKDVVTSAGSPALGALSHIIYCGVIERSLPRCSTILLSAHAAFHLELWNPWCASLIEWVTTAVGPKQRAA